MNYSGPEVFASYFNSTPDPQRKGLTWDSEVSHVMKLIDSVVTKNRKIKIFHDCFVNPPKISNCEWIKISDDLSTEFTASTLRWIRYYNYLKERSILPESLFMVDSTDVIMINDPFELLENNKIYCGDESDRKVENQWMRNREKQFEAPDYRQIIEAVADEQLLNAGICGGHIGICIEFLELLSNYHFQYNKISKSRVSVDMPAFNYTLWKHFRGRLIHGHPINTRFKFYENDTTKWWKHK